MVGWTSASTCRTCSRSSASVASGTPPSPGCSSVTRSSRCRIRVCRSRSTSRTSDPSGEPMSDAHHDEHVGGHEIDQMPNGRLFNLMIGLSILTLGACIGVVRLFDKQVESIQADRAKAGAYSRNVYRQEMAKIVDGYGATPLRDGDKELTLY